MACANLGVANDFNVFVLADHTQSFVDAGGRVAVGGNATYRSYGVGSSLNVSTTRADLIVGGKMDILQGTNFSGNSVISPSGTIVNYTMTNNNGVHPQPQIGTPVDFAAAAQFLTCASTSWGAMAATGTASVNFGQIVLTGTNPALNIFTINGNNVAGSGVSLASANGINIVTPAGSTVLVNISGTGVGFGNYAIFINGGQALPNNGAIILWNFFQATTAFNLNLSIKGSVLAPFAVWSAVGYGNIDGTMVAKSFINTTGSLEAHAIPFIGCLPEVFCTPHLTIRKTVNGSSSFSGTAGTPLVYVIQVSNTGGGTLTNVLVNDPLLGFSQTVPQLASGQEISFTINSEVQPGEPGSMYLNTATAKSDQTPQQSSSVTITIEGFLNVSLVKSADRLTAAPGDMIEYTFTVLNPGRAALQNVTLTDATLGLHLFFPTFTSGTIATYVYTVPLNAVIGSTFVNTAVLNASNLQAPVSAQASVLITETPTVTLMKTADRTTALPGDTIKYTVVVSNDSEFTTVYNLHLTDALISLDQSIAQLNPKASTMFEGMYTVPSGTPAGTIITNTAVLQSSLGTLSDTVQVTVAPAAKIGIAKTPRRPSVAPGDTVIYDIVVTNTGNIPLTNVVVSDPGLSFSTTIPTLPVGAQNASEAFFTVPLDTPAGTKFFNQATVTSNETPPASDTSEIIVAPVYSLSVHKQVAPSTAIPGETVEYTITVTNTSNDTITNVVVSDPTIGVMQTFVSMPAGSTVVIHAPFIIPADAVAGSVIPNTVSADSDQTPVRTSSTHVTVAANPLLTLTKSVTPDIANPGDNVTYTLILTNAGNIALTNVHLLDPSLGIDQTVPSLAIGTDFALSIPFTVPIVPPGTILTNTSTAVSDETPTPVEATAWVTVVAAPSITLAKSVSAASAAPGQTVTFSVSLTNNSLIPLTNVTLDDPFFGLTDTFPILQPGDTKVFTQDFTIPDGTTASTVFANVVTATSDQTPGVTAEADVTVLAVPGISITKTADVPAAFPGETVTYTIIVTNTGNTQLTNVLVTDDTPPLDSVVPVLGQGASSRFIIPYTLTGEDPPGTIIVNTAVARSTETGPVIANAAVLVTPLPSDSISIQKNAEPRIAAPGETVTYMIIVTNNTLITLFNIHVTDPMLGINETIAALASGNSVSLVFPFVIPAGTPGGTEFVNTATATVSGLSISASATVDILTSPSLTLTKTPDVQSALPGEQVNYTLTITNTGNIALTDIVVADPMIGFVTVVPLLAIGANQSFVVPFIVPPAPIGTIITNTSTATSDQTPEPVAATASISVGDPPTMAIAKTAVPASGAPGDLIAFTIVVTNTSAAILTNVIVTDPLLSWFEQIPVLLPGTSKTVVTHYPIPPFTAAGTIIVNTVTASSDQTLPVTAEAPILVIAAPSLSLRKIEDRVVSEPGSILDYAIEVTNTGNTPLTNVHLFDSLINLNETIAILRPQATVVLSIAFQIPLDAIAGSRIINIVTAVSDQTAPVQAMTNIRIGAAFSILVNKTAQSPTVQPGNAITFLTTITNTSNAALTNLFILDPLIELSETITSLAAGQTITFSSVLPVALNQPVHSQITNEVFVSTTETVVTSAQSTVTVLPGPRLHLTKDFPSLGYPGQRVQVTLVSANIGNQTVHNVRLTDALPHLSVHTAERLQDTTFTVYEFYTIPADAKLGSVIVNQAQLAADETDPVQVSKELLVVGLLVEKSAEPTTAELHGFVDYFIRVANPTPLPALEVVLRDPLATGTSLVPGSITVNGSIVADENLNDGLPLGTLHPGASVNVVFQVKIDADQPGDLLVNQAFASYTFISDFELRGTSPSNLVHVNIDDNEE
ncbi:DUF11 domain-containing protein [Paenibacillus rhizovicinus]|uniref:DUF11 domain-containing protein n=1 Tax=Paenibacillus rhizovicinus TaxID=2704463 RepID=A0A6C0NYZ3_9BACL|nr:choice-of-anchor A family protein [Paenibacillus rhizovicinus]QHW30913.1 DUF11 domain-containing protein [Paenibacillus rhizovicinus]